MWKILQSMYGQEELSKIEIDDTPAIMVERMAEIIAQKAENGAISVFVIDEVPMMTSRKNFTDRKEELRYMIGLLKKCEKKERVVIVAVIPVSKYCTEMQKKKRSEYLLWRNRKTRKLSGFRIDKNLSTYGIRLVVR